jgi:T-complex protein 1 subunit theta
VLAADWCHCANGVAAQVINHLEKLFVTNDAATIVGELEVQHPAAKLLVMASNMQEVEVGDGTNLVVVLAGELLSMAEELLKSGLHVSEIIGGYKAAEAKALELIDTLVSFDAPADTLHDATKLAAAIRSVIASKQWGNEDLFAARIAEACVLAMPQDVSKFNTDNIRVAKILGSSVAATTVVRGMCMPRGALGTIKEVIGAKIAVYGIPLDSATTETKGTVLLKSAADLKNYNDSEEVALEKIIKAIAATGVNMIVCGQAVGELALHFCEKHKIMVMKCPSKFELRRICRTTGANNLVRMEPPAPEDIGACEHVHIREIGSTMCTILENKGDQSHVATIVVRGSSPNIMDDVERAIDDGVNVIKAMTRDARFLPGAGGAELRLADALQQVCDEMPVRWLGVEGGGMRMRVSGRGRRTHD